jgi:DNA-binding transcriptional regulator GbsR (MarR family)
VKILSKLPSFDREEVFRFTAGLPDTSESPKVNASKENYVKAMNAMSRSKRAEYFSPDAEQLRHKIDNLDVENLETLKYLPSLSNSELDYFLTLPQNSSTSQVMGSSKYQYGECFRTMCPSFRDFYIRLSVKSHVKTIIRNLTPNGVEIFSKLQSFSYGKKIFTFTANLPETSDSPKVDASKENYVKAMTAMSLHQKAEYFSPDAEQLRHKIDNLDVEDSRVFKHLPSLSHSELDYFLTLPQNSSTSQVMGSSKAAYLAAAENITPPFWKKYLSNLDEMRDRLRNLAPKQIKALSIIIRNEEESQFFDALPPLCRKGNNHMGADKESYASTLLAMDFINLNWFLKRANASIRSLIHKLCEENINQYVSEISSAVAGNPSQGNLTQAHLDYCTKIKSASTVREFMKYTPQQREDFIHFRKLKIKRGSHEAHFYKAADSETRLKYHGLSDEDRKFCRDKLDSEEISAFIDMSDKEKQNFYRTHKNAQLAAAAA